MKRLFFIFIMFVVFAGCKKETTEMSVLEEVTVSLNYSFVETGSMSKASNQTYDDFYEKYVKSKVLTPKKFSLKFANAETGDIASIDGDWSKNHSLRLPTGEYIVTGISYPDAYACIDTLYLKFEENVSINSDTQSINLTAIYDSFLLMFDKSDKEEVKYTRSSGSGYDPSTSTNLEVIDEIYYAFFNELWANKNYIHITRTSGEKSTVYLDKIPFENGKYYYFNDLANSFDIPPMESGN